VNFLALLGWNPGNDQELMTLDEMVKLFDLSKCSKNGAKFDYVKAAWFNHQYLIQRPDSDWCPAFDKVLKENGIEATPEQEAEVVRMMKLKVIEYTDGQGNKKKRNISFPSDLWPLTQFFFVAPAEFDKENDKFIRKNWKENTADEMQQMMTVLISTLITMMSYCVISTMQHLCSCRTIYEISLLAMRFPQLPSILINKSS
jgi:glutamyl-tRNA synthetase